MKSKLKFGIFILLIFLIIGIGYKGYLLLFYRTDTVRTFAIKDTIRLTKKSLKEEEYFVVGNIKIRNDFSGFIKRENGGENSAIYYLPGEKSKTLMISITNPYVYRITEDQTAFGTEDRRFLALNRKGILNKYHI